MKENEVLDIVKVEVEKVMELLGIDANVTFNVEKGENGVIAVSVNVAGDDLGFMIGNRGNHMLSLQYILSTIVRNKVKAVDPDTSIAVILDVAGYRAQKRERVEKYALQKADDARILGEPIDLEPMNPADRRAVHAILSKFDDIKTESFGEDRDRFVRIFPLSEDQLGVTVDTNEDLLEDSQE